ncbi:MAG: phosphodiesterase YaeI [Opitutales bacterium]
MQLTRRGFLKLARRGVLASGLAAVGGGAYMRFVEPNWLEVVHYHVRLPGAENWPRPVRLLHLADFHALRSTPLSTIETAIERGLAEEPDIICVTGDFVTEQLIEPENFAAQLKRLAAAAPTYAVMGNHDGGAWSSTVGGWSSSQPMRTFVQEAGLRLLHNRGVRVDLGDDRALRLVGVGDLWSEECDVATAFGASPPALGQPTVLLAHNPDSKEKARWAQWQLMLSGHTHGGQLSLPVIGEPFAPVRDKRYVNGLRAWEGRWIQVTRGVGSGARARLNCRPEVSVLHIGGVTNA